MSLGETGARRASAISWAFWLTLPFLVRIARTASLRLCCRRWPWPRPWPDEGHPFCLLGTGSQRSACGCVAWPLANVGGADSGLSGDLRGLGLRAEGLPVVGASTWSGNFSIAGWAGAAGSSSRTDPRRSTGRCA